MNVNNVPKPVNNGVEFVIDNLTAIVSKTKAAAKAILKRGFVCGFIVGSVGSGFLATKYSSLLSGLPFNPPILAIAIVSGIIFGLGCKAIKASLRPESKPYDAVNDRPKDWTDYTEFPKDDYAWDDETWGKDLARHFETQSNCCAFPKLAIYISTKHGLTIDVAPAINDAYAKKYGENDFTKENRTLSAAEVFKCAARKYF